MGWKPTCAKRDRCASLSGNRRTASASLLLSAMDLRNEIAIDTPAGAAWDALGERFMHIGDWAAPIHSSCPLEQGELGVGAVRACYIARFGPVKPGTITERLTMFDRGSMSFEYEALEGMPGFVARATNRWSVHPVDEHRCIVRIHAQLTLRGPVVLLHCLLKWQMQVGGARVAEELKYYLERGRVHPRKLKALAAPTAQ